MNKKITKKDIIGIILMLPVMIAALVYFVELSIYCFTYYTKASICAVCMFSFFIGYALVFDDDDVNKPNN